MMVFLKKEAFAEKLCEELRGRLPGATAEFVRGTSPDEQGRIELRLPETAATPSILIDKPYEAYVMRNGSGEAVRGIADSIAGQLVGIAQVSAMATDYEKARERLFISVAGKGKMNLPDNVPSRKILDLDVTCHIILGNEGGSVISSLVTRKNLEAFGVSEDRLFADAFENSPKVRPARVAPLASFMRHMKGVPDGFADIFEEDASGLVVVTVEDAIRGAAALFYPGMMEQVADMAGGSFYALPSSIHEFLALPASAALPETDGAPLDIGEMIRDINRMCVAPEERLGDGAYYYDAGTGLFMKAEDMDVAKKAYVPAGKNK